MAGPKPRRVKSRAARPGTARSALPMTAKQVDHAVWHIGRPFGNSSGPVDPRGPARPWLAEHRAGSERPRSPRHRGKVHGDRDNPKPRSPDAPDEAAAPWSAPQPAAATIARCPRGVGEQLDGDYRAGREPALLEQVVLAERRVGDGETGRGTVRSATGSRGGRRPGRARVPTATATVGLADAAASKRRRLGHTPTQPAARSRDGEQRHQVQPRPAQISETQLRATPQHIPGLRAACRQHRHRERPCEPAASLEALMLMAPDGRRARGESSRRMPKRRRGASADGRYCDDERQARPPETLADGGQAAPGPGEADDTGAMSDPMRDRGKNGAQCRRSERSRPDVGVGPGVRKRAPR